MRDGVVLEFQLVPVLPYHSRYYRQLETVSISTVQYYLFMGRVTFRIGEIDFSLKDPVPVADFAVGMLRATKELLVNRAAIFEFTEGEGEITFTQDASGITNLRCTYHERSADVSALSLHEASLAFARRVLKMLQSDFPEILENQEFRDWFLPSIKGGRDHPH